MTLKTTNKQSIRNMTTLYLATTLAVFLVLILLGITMRVAQSSIVQLPADLFYAIMTLHGLGMVGVLFVGGMSALWYLISNYVDVSAALAKFNYALILIGVAGLIAATLIGRFGAGWYVLYPLPFLEGAWPSWSVGVAIVSVMLLGVAWLLWQLDVLRAIIARYGVKGFLGWKYFGNEPTGEEVPPIILIASVGTIAGSITTIFGAVLLVLYLFQWLNPDLKFDPLLMKNIVFLFGHTIVNITMYFGLGFVYEILPKYTGRPWKTNRIVAISWNSALVFVIAAYFHHLYMDFAQPTTLHLFGQIASYLSTVPATVVTVFGAIAQISGSGIKWSYVPTTLGLSLTGWLIGGFIAVVDSTIIVNVFFHNTLWVVSHFHTYFLLGFVMMLFAFIYEYFETRSEIMAKFSLASMIIGGYGIIMMFAWAGVNSVPRRYANYSSIPYPSVTETGEVSAMFGSVFALILFTGVIAFVASIAGQLNKNRPG